MKSSFGVFLIGWFCLTGAVFSLGSQETSAASHLHFGKDPDVIPLRPNSLYAVVDVDVGTHEYHFAVDTGSPVVIVSSRVIQENPELFAQYSSSNETGDTTAYTLTKMTIGELVVSDFVVYQHPRLEGITQGMDVDGLLGMTVLEQLYFELNLRDGTLLLATRGALSNGVDLDPLLDNRLVVGGSLDGEIARWTIDTGNPVGYFLRPDYFPTMPATVSVHPIEGVMGNGFYWQDSQSDPTFALAKDVVIGRQKFRNFPFRFLRVGPSYRTDTTGLFNTAGILPLSFFHDSVLKVDYQNRKISWDNGDQDEPYSLDMLINFGIELQPTTQPNHLKVIGLDPDGWAYEAGLRLGDVVYLETFHAGSELSGLLEKRKLLEFTGTFPMGFTYERDGRTRQIETEYYSPFLQP